MGSCYVTVKMFQFCREISSRHRRRTQSLELTVWNCALQNTFVKGIDLVLSVLTTHAHSHRDTGKLSLEVVGMFLISTVAMASQAFACVQPHQTGPVKCVWFLTCQRCFDEAARKNLEKVGEEHIRAQLLCPQIFQSKKFKEKPTSIKSFFF